MIPEIKNIVMVRGDTLAFDMTLYDVDATVESIYFSCKKYPTDDEYAFQKSLGNGITCVDDAVYRIRVAPADTANLPAGEYAYDLQLGLGADIFTILYGRLMLKQDVTEETV